MNRIRILAGTLAVAFIALLLTSCGDADGDQQSASQAQSAIQAEQADQPAQIEQTQQAEPEARVQVIRDRAFLGSPDAPVVIQEYSDFL
ncbi:MAG: hypothetical protein OXD50_07350 [Chloroflexi bacterium]|nr:hypothetical protein [Chloroflexota bacterium]